MIVKCGRAMAAAPVCAETNLGSFFHTFNPTAGCPLWVISRHTDKPAACPLYPQERTLGGTSKSAFGYRFMSTRPKLVLNRPDPDRAREHDSQVRQHQGDKGLKKADRKAGGTPPGVIA
jgi:hypothetical protein